MSAQKNKTSGEIICEILCIGREILDGRVIDTNSTAIAQEISKIGLRPQYAQKVDDDAARMKEAFQIAKSRAEIVFVCGGLGPTTDDRTLEIFSEFIGHKMTQYPDALEFLSKLLLSLNRPMNEPQLKQTRFPEGGSIIENPNGTACGFEIEWQGTRWFFLPGPPRELIPMLQQSIVPKLSGGKKFMSRAWITHFIGESDLQLKLNSVIQKIPGDWDFSFQDRFPEVALGLHAPGDANSELFQKLCQEIRTILDGFFWHEGEHSRIKLEEKVVDVLRQRNSKLVSVESCTGGMIAERITDVAGSSDVFLASWVTYANEAKIQLGVTENSIKQYGAVSEAVAQEMAAAGLKSAQTFWPHKQDRIISISDSGVAGPGGGSAEKPVGLCQIAIADSAGSQACERIQTSFKYSRDRNRRYFSQKALALVLKTLTNS